MPSTESLPLKSNIKAGIAHFRSTADFSGSSQGRINKHFRRGFSSSILIRRTCNLWKPIYKSTTAGVVQRCHSQWNGAQLWQLQGNREHALASLLVKRWFLTLLFSLCPHSKSVLLITAFKHLATAENWMPKSQRYLWKFQTHKTKEYMCSVNYLCKSGFSTSWFHTHPTLCWK